MNIIKINILLWLWTLHLNFLLNYIGEYMYSYVHMLFGVQLLNHIMKWG